MSWKASGYVKALTHSQTGEAINRGEKLVLLVLSDYHNERDGYAHPSTATLAIECLYTKRQVLRIIESLEKKGFVTVERNANENNRYFIIGLVTSCHQQNSQGGDILKGGGDILNEKSAQNVTRTNNNHKNRTNTFRPFGDVLKVLTQDEWELEKLPKIWDYFIQKTEKHPTSYRAIDSRVKLGLQRLRDCVQANTNAGDVNAARKEALRWFKIAIDNLAEDEFLSGNNDRKKEYREWDDHLCKDWKTFEKRLRAK